MPAGQKKEPSRSGLGCKGTRKPVFGGTEETTFTDRLRGRAPPPRHQAARRALAAVWVVLTAWAVTAWKLASATSAACLAALWTLS